MKENDILENIDEEDIMELDDLDEDEEDFDDFDELDDDLDDSLDGDIEDDLDDFDGAFEDDDLDQFGVDMDMVENEVAISEDLEGFAKGFPDWDIHPPKM